MDHTIRLREVRERCATSVHPAIRHSVTAAPHHPMEVRSALFTIEEYIVISGRPVPASEVPKSLTAEIEVLTEGVPTNIEQFNDPELFTHQYMPRGRWIASQQSVQMIGGAVDAWYPSHDSESRLLWKPVGSVRLLASRNVSTPMFGYRGADGWPSMDAVELDKQAQIVLKHEPMHGSRIALMVLGQFDIADDEYTLVEMRSMGAAGYSLIYDWNSRLLAMSGVYEDTRPTIPNPMVQGRLAALLMICDPTGVSVRIMSNGKTVGASLGRFDLSFDQIVELVVSCGYKSSSRVVEVCLWQSDKMNSIRVENQVATLLSYYERRVA